jgi:hypothetical protein
VAISELDRFSGGFTRARGVSQIRRNKICFASRGANLRDCFLPALDIPTDDHDMDASLVLFADTRSRFGGGAICAMIASIVF